MLRERAQNITNTLKHTPCDKNFHTCAVEDCENKNNTFLSSGKLKMRNNFQESLQIQHVACEICNCCTIERLLFHNQYFLYFLHSNISRHCDQKISRPLKNYPHQMIFLLRAIPILHISQNHFLMHVSLNIQVKKFRNIHNLTLDWMVLYRYFVNSLLT